MISQPMKWLFTIGLIGGFFTCVPSGAAAMDLYDVPVKSYQNLEIRKFQQLVSRSEEDGELWVKDALQVALRFVGPFEGKLQHIFRKNDSAESASKVEVVVIEEGYLDDSVRGARYKILLEKGMNNIWQLIGATKSWRCWRGRGHENFSKNPCL